MTSEAAKLTIAIPTFNRNKILLENIQLLLPQLTERCVLLIVDNCSPIPVAKTLRATLDGFPHADISIVRNEANIGGDPNILRCFELCATEWLWVLGDDDPVRPNAIETILSNLDLYPEAVYFNFLVGLWERDRTFTTEGLAGFAREVDVIANLLFVPSGVYRRAAVISHLPWAAQYAYSMAVSLIILVKSLGETGLCCFSNAQIITFTPAPIERAWSSLRFALGVMIPLELVPDHTQKRELARKIINSIPQSRTELFLQSLQLAIRPQRRRDAIYLYDQLCYRLYYFEPSLFRKMKMWLCRLMMRSPHLSYKLINAFMALKGTTIINRYPLRGES